MLNILSLIAETTVKFTKVFHKQISKDWDMCRITTKDVPTLNWKLGNIYIYVCVCLCVFVYVYVYMTYGKDHSLKILPLYL